MVLLLHDVLIPYAKIANLFVYLLLDFTEALGAMDVDLPNTIAICLEVPNQDAIPKAEDGEVPTPIPKEDAEM